MKRLRILFAIGFLLLALPFWRWLDLVAIFSPFRWLMGFSLNIAFAVFVLIPAKLIVQKLKTYALLLLMLGFALLSWFTPSLSLLTTTRPELNHCGSLTWSGAFYPLRKFLTQAHQDDLEARNQMCWVRKMITAVPAQFSDIVEIERFSKNIRDQLLKPQIKYRVALPLVSFLQMSVIAEVESKELAPGFSQDKMVFESIDFWQNQYTTLISEQKYGIGSFPHSEWIKFEYGLLERNWQSIIDNLVLESR